jgi:quinoprotein dehydrogenase-associated probable ABC transporter substrate-binding protein
MSSRCRERRAVVSAIAVLLGAVAFLPLTRSTPPPPGRVLRVAADPNNLPFSNDRLEGFENKLIARVAQELEARVEYTWRAQRRGFFRETLKEGNCDIVAGVPRGFDPVLTTTAYYQSTYVLIYRKSRQLGLRSLDDPRLRELTIGVQMIGDDFANTPPAHALSRRGIIQNVRGFTVYGDYRERDPPSRIVAAVAVGEIDVAIVWGPLAGFFAAKQKEPLEIVPLAPFDEVSGQRFAFAIAMGVRRSSPELRNELNGVLARLQPEIDALLASYHVPLMPLAEVKR